ncbi:MAG TPA: hypothetical protein VE821_06160, partial [Pyrinomonadaceae bacterium]|nr:hypothetical protein [Pyrinomonadaceae bacterium]
FANVPGGDYLIEVYVNGEMIYQQKISLPSSIASNSKLVTLALKSGGGASWTKVQSNTRLEQRHKLTLQGDEFRGQITVYAGDIHATNPFPVIVFKTEDGNRRWLDSKGLDEQALRKLLGNRKMADTQINPNSSREQMKAGFDYKGHHYSLDITRLETHGANRADYLYFEIWRAP